MMRGGSKVFIAGGTGLLGSALIRKLQGKTFSLSAPSRQDLNLLNKHAVDVFFEQVRPNYVFLAAAKVGSIAENIKNPIQFLEENILIQQNVINAAHRFGVVKLLFFSSNCCYPRDCSQPMKEESFMTGPLEATNEAYAIAKIAGMKLCQSYNNQYGTKFYCAVLASLYGPNDHLGSEKAHVVGDMIFKFHQAKEAGTPALTFWGDGSPLREFLYVDDAADAAVFLMEKFNPNFKTNFVNIGSGEEVSIKDLARMISGVVGYKGQILWDSSRPNGMPRKLLDSTKFNSLGWKHRTVLEEGIRRTYECYLQSLKFKETR